MSIWEHRDVSEAFEAKVISTPKCIFCSTILDKLETRYEEEIDFNSDTAKQVAVCPTCGWWKIVQLEQEIVPTFYWGPDFSEPWDDGYHRHSSVYAAIGKLKELDLTDIQQPITDIRNYLVARYEKRFQVHPRLFEKTVGSVFHDLGYRSRVTSYSNDGGIDVILDGPRNELIGVQVKRRKDSISVEQIRSLTGALLIGGFTRGVFVTTSQFQSGAGKTCALSQTRGLPIELLDADRFLSALRIAQRERYSRRNDPDAPFFRIPFSQLKRFDC